MKQADVLAAYAADIARAPARVGAEAFPQSNFDAMTEAQRAAIHNHDYLLGFLRDPATMCLQTGLLDGRDGEESRRERFRIAQERRAVRNELRQERPR